MLAAALALPARSHAVAQSEPSGGSFACRASALNLLGIEPVIANVAGVPCTDVARRLLDLPDTSLGVRAVSARTQPVPAGGGATSQARVAGVDLALFGLRADAIEARATAGCDAGRPRLAGTSSVVGLTVNGQPLPAGGTATLPVPAGTLHLNHTATVGNALVQRAVWLETALGSVVLGEAQVGYTGNPCVGGITVSRGTGITVVQVSEPEGPAAFPFEGDLGDFSLRDDGSTADQRIFALPGGRYRISQLQPTGGLFPDDWFLRDVECTDAETVLDLQGRTVLVDLDEGEHVVCTFTNRNELELALSAASALENPAEGLDPVVFGGGQETPSRPTPRAAVEPPSPPPTTSTSRAMPPVDEGGSLLSANTGFIAIPLVAVLGGALWFVLAGTRRRREDESA